jgi:hypothetical protein
MQCGKVLGLRRLSATAVQFIVLGLMGLLSILGAGLGWWYGTSTFYVRTALGDTRELPMSGRRRVKRHARRVLLTVAGAAGGALLPVVGLMLLKRF